MPAAPREASLVKLLACRSAELVTREALQLHGGMGYAEETRSAATSSTRACCRSSKARRKRWR
jgi:alkylation response protein AidB-like acyl-CoA dehydrogenase